jgi:hypothetical protein
MKNNLQFTWKKIDNNNNNNNNKQFSNKLFIPDDMCDIFIKLLHGRVHAQTQEQLRRDETLKIGMISR